MLKDYTIKYRRPYGQVRTFKVRAVEHRGIAVAQCREWLDKKVPGAFILPEAGKKEKGERRKVKGGKVCGHGCARLHAAECDTKGCDNYKIKK